MFRVSSLRDFLVKSRIHLSDWYKTRSTSGTRMEELWVGLYAQHGLFAY